MEVRIPGSTDDPSIQHETAPKTKGSSVLVGLQKSRPEKATQVLSTSSSTLRSSRGAPLAPHCHPPTETAGKPPFVLTNQPLQPALDSTRPNRAELIRCPGRGAVPTSREGAGGPTGRLLAERQPGFVCYDRVRHGKITGVGTVNIEFMTCGEEEEPKISEEKLEEVPMESGSRTALSCPVTWVSLILFQNPNRHLAFRAFNAKKRALPPHISMR